MAILERPRADPPFWIGSLLFLCVVFSSVARADQLHAEAAHATSELPSQCQSAPGSGQSAKLLQALAAHPSAEAYNALGAAYAKAGKLDCAIPAFQAALQGDPQSWRARYNLALVFFREHHFSRASRELRVVIRQKPDLFPAYDCLGMALQGLGQWKGAAEAFKTAIRINPNFANSNYHLAQFLSLQRRYRASIYYLHRALAASPPPSPELDYQARLTLAAAYAGEKDYKNSIASFQQLLALYPKSSTAHFELANACAQNHQYVRAAAEYETTLRLDPGNDAARLSLAKALMVFNQVKQAVPDLQEYIQRKPGDFEGYELLGEAYKNLGQDSDAVPLLRRAVQMNPDSYKGHYDLGVALEHSGHFDQAIEQLEMAKKLKPGAAEVLYQLGITLTKKRKFRAAKQNFDAFQQTKLTSDTKERARVIGNDANGYLAQGKVKEALNAYRKAVKMAPGDAVLHFNFALALSRAGDRADEERELERALQITPTFSKAHEQLGMCYMADGNSAGAEKEFKAALAADSTYAEAENNLAVLYGREGRNAQAETLFQQATTDNPQYADAFFNWGLILASEGRYAEAESKFRKTLNLDPKYSKAFTALKMAELEQGKKRPQPQPR